MNIQDGIDYVEDRFTCDMGAPWTWADYNMTKPYQKIEFDMDVPSLHAPEDHEHRLVSRMIVALDKLKKAAGYRPQDRPKLFWRWKNKIRLEYDDDGPCISTRVYLDGNPGYITGNPSKPRGRPTVGQIKKVA